MHRQSARGLGRSYLDGFRAALQTDADFVCQMDADLSHDPKFLPALVAGAENGARAGDRLAVSSRAGASRTGRSGARC